MRAAPLLLATCATVPDAPVGSDPARVASDGGSRCEDFALDAERVWSREQSNRIRVGLLKVSSDSAERTVERIVTRMDAISRDWVMLREKACKDTLERELMPKEVYVKVSACLDVALLQQRTAVTLLDAPEGKTLARAEQALERILVETASCQHAAVYDYYDAAEPNADEALATASVYASFQRPDAPAQAEQAAKTVESDASVRRRFEVLRVQAESMLFDQLRVQDAMALARQALALAQSEGYEAGEADVLLLMGRAQWWLGDLQGSLGHLDKALAIRSRILGSDADGTQQVRDVIAMALVDLDRRGATDRVVAYANNDDAMTQIWLWTLADIAFESGYFEVVGRATDLLMARSLSDARRLVAQILAVQAKARMDTRDFVGDVARLVGQAKGYQGSRAEELLAEVKSLSADLCVTTLREASATKSEALGELGKRYCDVYESAYGTLPDAPRAPLAPCWTDDGACSTRAWLTY